MKSTGKMVGDTESRVYSSLGRWQLALRPTVFALPPVPLLWHTGGCLPDVALIAMSLDPYYLACFLTPSLTGIAVALCVTRAISDHFYRRKHLVPPEQVVRRAALRRKKHILIGAIWVGTLLGIGLMMLYFAR